MDNKTSKRNMGNQTKKADGSLSKLVSYSKAHLPGFISAIILAILGTVLNTLGPMQLSKITGIVEHGMDTKTAINLGAIGKIGVFLIVAYIIGFILNYAQGFIVSIIAQKISKKLRSDITGKINALPLKYFDATSYGDILSRITNDVDSIAQTLDQSISSLVISVTTIISSLIIMLSINITLTVSALGATFIGFILMVVIMSKSQKYFSRQQEDLGKMNGHIEEIYTGHTVVKIYNGEKAAKKTLGEINERLFDSAWKSQFMSGVMQPLMQFIGNLGYVVVCVVGAILAIRGSIGFGVIVAFILYVRQFTQPLSQLAQIATSLQSTAAASKRVFEFLEEPEMEDERGITEVLDNVYGNVDFEHVSFGYNKDKTIVNDFTINVKSGQKIAIVGPTGAGKTTIVNLLMRFYEIDSGQILVDGIPTTNITRENVHNLFCMVLQDTWLFEGTVKENIIYNQKNISDEHVKAACKAAGVDHFIKTLPHGYNTILNDKTALSEGEKQLLTIVRAMLKGSPMLILDEATSSVDTRTELIIQGAMDKLMEGKTSFVIAHRLSTIKNADQILVMKDGDIIENGNHDDLIKQNGFYSQLYNSQFSHAI